MNTKQGTPATVANTATVTPERDFKRRVVCAANRYNDGSMLIGARHWDKCMQDQARARGWITMLGEMWCRDKVPPGERQGFIDQFGTFMGRIEAWEVASAAGQIRFRCGGDTASGGTLYSENLY